jgi:hypothetical protein
MGDIWMVERNKDGLRKRNVKEVEIIGGREK